MAPTCTRRSWLLAPLLLAAVLIAIAFPVEAAAQPGSARARQVVLPATSAQHGLAVRVTGDHVLARACARGQPCTPEGGQRLAIHAQARPNAAAASVQSIALGRGRHVALVSAPGSRLSERWVLLLAASLADQPPAVVKPLTGWLGRSRGQPGERANNVLLRERSGPGSERVVLGTQYEHVSVCGRKATIRTRELDPVTLGWRWVGARSLSEQDRAAATQLVAERADTSLLATAPRLLHPQLASSAVGRDTSGLTDGNVQTTWAEARPGDGAGEFVVLSSSSDVVITGFELVVRPEGAESASTVAPQTVWIATPERLFELRLPADAGQQPAGSLYGAMLPEPLQTDCVALVLGKTAHLGESDRVAIAEFRARTDLDDAGGYSGLVSLLAGDAARARAAAALLSRSGLPAVQATMAGYSALDPVGRRRALDVIRAGPCTAVVGFFVAQLLAASRVPSSQADLELFDVARSRLRECGGTAAESFRKSLPAGELKMAHARAASELALFAPDEAVPIIVGLLDRAGGDVRRELRAALSTAAKRRRARRSVEAELAAGTFAARPLVTRIDLLRSIGPLLAELPGAAPALQSVLGGDRSFRTRYLLQVPAGHVARGGDPFALTFVRSSLLADESPHVRAQAARAAGGVPRLSGPLGQALGDAGPRVRQAALEALSDPEVPLPAAAERNLMLLLRSDVWTFVREAAARALTARPPSPRTDQALLSALEDESSRVRAAALDALGQRRSSATIEFVRDKAGEPKETIAVRRAAIRAVGVLCDAKAIDLLIKLALRTAHPQLPYDQPLGEEALKALGRLKPPDLRTRIAPLLHPRVRPNVRSLALSTLREPGSCGGRKRR